MSKKHGHHPDCNADFMHEGLCSKTFDGGTCAVFIAEPDGESLKAGSNGEKYGLPGTTDWTGEGRPDHERREQ